jgi:DNA-directed RNA polymerase subunit RPC12/RpoP
MLANVPLRDVQPTVMVCPHCAQRLMDITDVQWALTRLEFTYGCAGCGAEVKKAVEGSEPVVAFTSRASALLRDLQIFSFSPDAVGARSPAERPPLPSPATPTASRLNRFG